MIGYIYTHIIYTHIISGCFAWLRVSQLVVGSTQFQYLLHMGGLGSKWIPCGQGTIPLNIFSRQSSLSSSPSSWKVHLSHLVHVHHINQQGCLKVTCFSTFWMSQNEATLQNMGFSYVQDQTKDSFFWILDDLCQGFLTIVRICWVCISGIQALILEDRHIEALPSECFGSTRCAKVDLSTRKQGNFEFLL